MFFGLFGGCLVPFAHFYDNFLIAAQIIPKRPTPAHANANDANANNTNANDANDVNTNNANTSQCQC